MTARIHDIDPLPAGVPMTEEGLEHYEDTLRNHHKAWAEVLHRNHERIVAGHYSLHWMNTDDANWGKRAKPSSRGLTMTDINRIRGYGKLPDQATWRNFAPRGSVRDDYLNEMPVIGDYVVTDKNELWADNVLTLYEEAKARQWNATRDIP